METFLKNILKKSLTKKEIIEKRSDVINHIKNDEISIKIIRQLVKSINREFFNNLIELPKVKEGYIIENPSIMAFYNYKDNTIYVNFSAINQTREFLHKFSKLNIKNQELNLNIQDNFLQAVGYVIEHELCHLAIFNYLPEISTKEVAHGRTFRKFVKNLFGHGWGDFAFIHINEYIKSRFNKKKFFELLNLENNYDDEYKEEVYKRLYQATTLSNFYKLLFTRNTARNTTRKIKTSK